MTETATPRFRYLGVTDDCVVCEKCRKPNLKSTVVLDILDADGNSEGDPVYYGSTCAARVLNVTGRGASARVLGLARAAHRELVRNAYDGRKMLAAYGLPETGEPTEQEVRVAAIQYAQIHGNARWANTQTGDDWRDIARSMINRKRAALAEAARLNVAVPTDDREMQRFINTW